MELIDILQRLSATDAPSGFEQPVAELAAELLRPYCAEVTVDPLGSVIARRPCGREGAKRVLLDAHIDEIGFVITGEDAGFLRFSNIGGVDPRVLPASTLKILTEPPIFGVVDVMPPHVLAAGESDKAQKIEDLRLDVGGVSVPVGTPAVFAVPSTSIGEHFFMGKALDDRACFAAIVAALDKLGDTPLDFDVYVLASTQEEVGTRGAQPAAYAINPDFAIVADVTFGDQPDLKPHETAKLGSGASIDLCPNADRAFSKKIIAIAEKIGKPLQIFANGEGQSGTNAAEIQLARDGVVTALLGLPLRYMHTPSETLDLRDVDALAEIIAETLKGGVINA
ncbi:MAG: M20/M25/M40 family metallo-hydrolase [Oscillospiraceae bacterium]|nr:M20/M25/M40 family metallo-hydrolase [Oscillospiraceae bacterium]